MGGRVEETRSESRGQVMETGLGGPGGTWLFLGVRWESVEGGYDFGSIPMAAGVKTRLKVGMGRALWQS